MKLRCPYCKEEFEQKNPRAICPKCGKAMIIPASLTPFKYQKKQPGKLRRKSRFGVEDIPWYKDPNLGRKPIIAGGLLVLMLISGGLLLGRTSMNYKPQIMQKRQTVVLRELNNLRMGLELFRVNCGRYPTTEEWLIPLVRNPGIKTWKGPYVTLVRRDQWLHRYIYKCEGEKIILFSIGPDGEAGTEDDLYPPEYPQSDSRNSPDITPAPKPEQSSSQPESGIEEKASVDKVE